LFYNLATNSPDARRLVGHQYHLHVHKGRQTHRNYPEWGLVLALVLAPEWGLVLALVLVPEWGLVLALALVPEWGLVLAPALVPEWGLVLALVRK